MSSRLCPDCGVFLSAGRMGPVALEVCFSCGGVWFDRGQLLLVVQAGPAVLWRLSERVRSVGSGRATVPAPAAPCPGCRATLAAAEYSSMPGVKLRGCAACQGFWVDADALGRIAARVTGWSAGAGPQPASERPMAGAAPAGPAPPPPPAANAPAVPAAAPPPAAAEPPTASAPTPRVPTRPVPVTPAEAASVPCPGCGQPNSRRAPVCWACGRQLHGVAVGPCPRCSGARRRLRSDTIELSACEDCGGVWLEDSRLGALLIQPPELQDALINEVRRLRSGRMQQVHGTLFCPRCDLLMFSAPLGMMSPRPIDTCPQCRAIFLDSGVLDEILLAQRR